MVTIGGEVARIDAGERERVNMLWPKVDLEAIDAWGEQNRLRGRSAAIRALVRIGLEAAKAAKGECEGEASR